MAPKPPRKRQARLQFAPIPSSPQSPQKSQAHVRISGQNFPAKRRRTRQSLHDQQTEDADLAHALELSEQADPSDIVKCEHSEFTGLPTPAASSQLEVTIGEDDETPRRRKYGLRTPKKRRVVLHSSDEESKTPPAKARLTSDESSDIEAPRSPASRPPSSGRKPSVSNFVAGGSTGNAPVASRRRNSNAASSRRAEIQRRDSAVLVNSDSDSLMEELGEKSRPRGSNKSTPRSAKSVQLDRKSETDESSESDEEGPLTNTRKRRLRRAPREDAESTLERSSSEKASSTASSPMDLSKARSELASRPAVDISDTEDGVERSRSTEVRQSRTRGRPAESKRDQKRIMLEELKQRRLEKKLGNVKPIEVDDEEDSQDSVVEEDLSWTRPDLKEDEYESDFVDEDGEFGVDLAREGVPIHLTARANLKPFDYFANVVEWMVHNKVDPAFERHDEIYDMSHRKLDDEVKGRAQSTFNSAAWTTTFTKALRSRPEYFASPIGFDRSIMSGDKCEACNRSGHPPKFEITFSGNRYDKNTLEKASKGHSNGSESESGKSSSSDDGDDDEDEESQEEGENFLVGRFCFANAEIGHTLHHWRYQLNQDILSWLKDNGHLSAEQVVRRENWSRKKRQKYANKIVDGMKERGEMKDLYRTFKKNLEAARSAKPERFVRR